MQTVRIATLGLIAIAIAACQGPNGVAKASPSPPAVAASHGQSPASTAEPATSASPPVVAASPAAPAASSRCHTSQVGVNQAGSEGAAGTIVVTYRMTNLSGSQCAVFGYVGLQMLDAGGRALPTRVIRSGGIFEGAAGPSLVTLPAHDAATFQVAYSQVPHGTEMCPESARLVVTPPDERDHLTIASSLRPCNAGELDVTPLRARCHTSQLAASPAGSNGAAGTIVLTFRLANTTATACTLFGFVGMQLLDGAGRALPTRVVRNGGIFLGQAAPTLFTLSPAAAANFQVAFSDVPHGSETVCPEATKLIVTPPDEFDHLAVPVSLAPCNGGELDVTPVLPPGAGPA